ncbi:hypothetical protein B0H13DRAFT_2229543 [Mycena leptocephala]|nr:hypothetical protein B0H13DRAFT_2229543 [Mycena leptocephala]
MSRRPSALSFSLPGPLANGPVKVVQSPTAPEVPAPLRRPSVSKFPADVSELDPDELFTKYTVAEVKFAQQRLRADADAKQEELRLMVGERYRDLLQASTSIISIARSSKRVIEALQETKDAIFSQDEPPCPSEPPVSVAALLSAHLKLLLDAPEYLWRLIERKKYFTAAWLFLLARVVHRALVRDDEQDEETWSAQGLDVLEQFPLAQRQWEAVSQFRSQIIHKATLSLREYTTSAEDACAALLTLHLLDSRPLTEALSVFLSQRSKTLLAMLSRTTEHPAHSPLSPSFIRRANGHVPEKRPAPSTTRKASVREVKEATQAALEAMVKTLTTFKTIMIGAVLEYIQSDSAGPDPNAKSLPSELQLTTQSLLATLPSSTHFLLLPPSLRSSSSSLIEQAHFSRISNRSLQVAASKWFSDLHTVAEVWTLRASIRQWIDASDLKSDETVTLKSIFGDAAQQRLQPQHHYATSPRSNARVRSYTSPVEFLFNAPPLPVFPGLGPVDSSFQKYKASLRRQLLGRTSLLDSVLAILESCARSIQRDLSVVLGGEDEEARGVVAQLSEQYRPNAEALCTGVLDTLSAAEKQDADDSDSLVFVGHIADELGSSSPFVSGIGGSAEVVQDFKKRTKALHDRIIDRWRTHTVSRIVGQYRAGFRPKSKTLPLLDLQFFVESASTPSSGLVESLLTLSSSVQELGISRSRGRQDIEADKTLRLFITEWVEDGWKQNGMQALCDIAFLRRLADLRAPDGKTCLNSSIPKRSNIESSSTPIANGWNDGAADYLARTQTLFAALLPLQSPMRTLNSSADKFAPLLPFGSPAMDQQFQPAVELANRRRDSGCYL